MTNRTKTLLCVAVAGLLFIPAVLFNIWYLVIVGAFFDWLPLTTGWMRFEPDKPKRKDLITAHVIVTLIAYLFAVLWVITFVTAFKFFFIEIWWLAVILGVLV